MMTYQLDCITVLYMTKINIVIGFDSHTKLRPYAIRYCMEVHSLADHQHQLSESRHESKKTIRFIQ